MYTLRFPEAVEKKKVMLMGLDVCHAGDRSIVGLSASINPEMSQYYSEHFMQKKGQEIVIADMQDAVVQAIEAFASQHDGQTPTNFIFFRDGVSDAMREKVLKNEVNQFESAIK